MWLILAAALAATPPEAEQLPPEIRATYIEALTAGSKGETESAEALLAAVNEQLPEFDDAWRNRCVAARMLKQDVARTYCERAVELAPAKWINHRSLVSDCLTTDDLDAAQVAAEAGLQAHPAQTELVVAAAEVAWRQRDASRLKPLVEQLEATQPDLVWTMVYRYLHAILIRDDAGIREGLAKVRESTEYPASIRRKMEAAIAEIPPAPATSLLWSAAAAVGLGGALLMGALWVARQRRKRSPE